MWEAKKNSYLSSYDFFVHLKGKMKERSWNSHFRNVLIIAENQKQQSLTTLVNQVIGKGAFLSFFVCVSFTPTLLVLPHVFPLCFIHKVELVTNTGHNLPDPLHAPFPIKSPCYHH